MEKNLFDWAAWDLVSDTLLQFYGCVLLVPIGKFKVGDVVPVIVVDFENGILQLCSGGGRACSGELISEHKVQMVIAD